MFRRKKDKDVEKQQYVPIAYLQNHQRQMDWFIKTCEKFDYIKIKDGRATGYMMSQLPELQPEVDLNTFEGMKEARRRLYNQGSGILIPEMIVIPYAEF